MTRQILSTEDTSVNANGIRLAYDTFGNSGDPPLVLIMGLGAQMIAWDEVFCTELATRGFWVVRFDNRDVGLSTKLEEAGVPDMQDLLAALNTGAPVDAPYLLRDMADDTVGLLDALGIDSAHIVGLSLGGMIAQELAIHHPRRVRTITCLMSSMGLTEQPPPEPAALQVLLSPPAADRAAHIKNEVAALRVFNGDHFPMDEARIRELAGLAYDRGLCPTGMIRQMAALLASGSRREALEQVNVPALIIHGDADPLSPIDGGRATAATIPGAVLLEIAGMGHHLPSALWTQVIDAIARHAV